MPGSFIRVKRQGNIELNRNQIKDVIKNDRELKKILKKVAELTAADVTAKVRNKPGFKVEVVETPKPSRAGYSVTMESGSKFRTRKLESESHPLLRASKKRRNL